MPGAVEDAHELHQLAAAPHHKVRRYAQIGKAAEVRVGRAIQPAVEQILDRVAAELPRRQGNRVQHDKARVALRRPFVEVPARGLPCAPHQAV